MLYIAYFIIVRGHNVNFFFKILLPSAVHLEERLTVRQVKNVSRVQKTRLLV